MTQDAKTESKQPAKKPVQCSCVNDPFASLPSDVHPPSKTKKSSLRKATCPGCGLDYRTNRPTDVCIDCEKKGITSTDKL